MFAERLREVFRFVPWEDTFYFHAQLFRCLLFDFLGAHSELALSSQRTERIWITIVQSLASVGLVHDTDGEPGASSRCPPWRGNETTSWPSPETNNQTMSSPPFVTPILQNHDDITGDLHDVRPVDAINSVDFQGFAEARTGDDKLVSGASILGYLLLWLFAIVALRSRTPSDARAACRLPRMAVGSTTDVGERVVRSLPWYDTPRDPIEGVHVDERQASMPGAWFDGYREQRTLRIDDGSASYTMPWILFHPRVRTRIATWGHVPDLSSLFGISDHGSNGAVAVERRRTGTGSDSPTSNESGPDSGVSAAAALNGKEEGSGAAPERFTSAPPGPRIGLPDESTTGLQDRRRRGPVAMDDDVAGKESTDLAQTPRVDVIREPRIGSPFALAATSDDADRESSNGDEIAGDGGSDGRSLERRTDEKPDAHHDDDDVFARQQDGSLSQTGCPLLLRRTSSAGCLWRERDVFEDNDEDAPGDDFYWTDQVNSRLRIERDARRGPHGSGLSDGSWPREGREDKSDNWRVRSSPVYPAASPEPRQVDDNRTKRRYSSPPLSTNTSASRGSHLASSRDGPQAIYVVPQKRGPGCWSPVSAPRASDTNPTGLGFFPFRKTPSFLVPESWRPGCLYVPDPPADESTQAKAWSDRLSYGGATATEHALGTDARRPISWRERYENDPASRRIMPGHRRTATQG